MKRAEAAAGRSGGIVHLSPVRASSFPEEWYEISSVDHFWFEWRLRAALRLIRRVGLYPQATLRVLDVGGGAGLLRQQLERHTRWTVDLCDVNSSALEAAVPGRGRTLYYDVLQRDPSLAAAYDVCVLFDVLEHIEDTRTLLSAIAHHLRKGAVLLVNVPAHASLTSAYDRAAGHLRRYGPRSLRGEFRELAFEVLVTRQWGLSLLPLLWLRKLLLGRHPDARTIRRGFDPPSTGVHALLKAVMAAETALMPLTPVGISLVLGARWLGADRPAPGSGARDEHPENDQPAEAAKQGTQVQLPGPVT
jgi:SAM-dependent methyltransferase